MLVKAIKVGFYDELRSVNEEFHIESEKDLGSWMVEITPAKKVQVAKKALVKPSGKKR